jgi:ribosomal-protein-alanine N-acetyltransferase
VALLSEVEGRAIGFLIGRQAADEAEILNLAVAKESRRKGEGGALLEAALERFRARGVSRVFLEVRDSNAAGLAFYAKHGFSKIGRREGYYREPFESAIVMEKKFTA